MSDKKKSFYTSEFKESAIKLAAESDRSIAQTAKDLGVNISTLHNWMHKHSKQKGVVVSIKEDPVNEVKRLTKELRLVKEERDILKKAAAYFAKHIQ